MARPVVRKIAGWIFDHLLWDTGGSVQSGFWAGLWGTRKLLLALVGSTLLTWLEWVEHHPPDIVIVAVIHFVFVLFAIALLVYIGHWFNRNDTTSLGKR
jgi:hypothetical protein